MTKIGEQRTDDREQCTPRPWLSGSEYEQEANLFLQAAYRFIGRGQPRDSWCESQRLRMRLACVVENSDWTEQGVKTLQHMLRIADGSPNASDRRCRCVQAIQAWGGSWRLPKWQASAEARRVCLGHLVSALEALDSVFGLLRHELGSVATKLDAYNARPDSRVAEKSAERVLAELIVEGADALGFVVEPLEPMEAEIKRIERQLERDIATQHLNNRAARRTSQVMRKARPRAKSRKFF